MAPHGDASASQGAPARLTVDGLAPVPDTPPEVAGLCVVLARFGSLGQRLALQQEPEEELGAVVLHNPACGPSVLWENASCPSVTY